MSLPFKLTVRYGRKVFEIELPPHDSTLKGLQTKLELLTTVRPSLQRLIGPKGMLVSGHKALANNNNNNNLDEDDDGENDNTYNNNNNKSSPQLSQIGIIPGMQILLVGAR